MNKTRGRCRRSIPFFLLGVLLISSVAGAAEYRTVEDSTPQAVMDAMARKVVRGVANVATGWLELPKQIYLTSHENGAVEGAVLGPIKGAGMVLVRTATGVVDTVTFLFPFPGNFYEPMFEPAYVWQKE